MATVVLEAGTLIAVAVFPAVHAVADTPVVSLTTTGASSSSTTATNVSVAVCEVNADAIVPAGAIVTTEAPAAAFLTLTIISPEISTVVLEVKVIESAVPLRVTVPVPVTESPSPAASFVAIPAASFRETLIKAPSSLASTIPASVTVEVAP